VRHAAGLDHEVAGTRLEHVVAELDAEAAFHHVGVLVLVVVGVQRRAQRARRERVLDQAERAAGGLASIMKRTPRASRCTTSPSPGPSRLRVPAGISPILSLDVLSTESCGLALPGVNIQVSWRPTKWVRSGSTS
jgi:hypothetical protein